MPLKRTTSERFGILAKGGSGPIRFGLIPSAVVFASITLCSTVFAGNGDVTVIPRAVGAARHGVQLELDTRGVDGNGYRPVRARIFTANCRPSAVERTFLIELSPDESYGNDQQQVAKHITLPAGAISAETVILFRQTTSTGHIRTAVYEGDRQLREFSSLVNIANQGGDTEMWPSMLHIDSRAPPRELQARIRRGGAQANCDSRTTPRSSP